jgi:hypothetical protein
MATDATSLQEILKQGVGGVPVFVIAIVSIVSVVITINAMRYESFSWSKISLILLTLLLEASVVQLFFPLVKAGTFIFGACQGTQTLAFRVYSIVKSREVYNLLAHHKVVSETYGKLFWISVISEIVGTIAGIVGFLVDLHFILFNAGSGNSAAGTALLIIGGIFIFVGYIGYLFFLNILRLAGAPRVIARMVWAQLAQFFLIPLLAGLTLGAVQYLLANFGTSNTAQAVVYVYAVIGIYIATKLTSVTMLGYTIWDICLLSRLQALKEYDETELGSRKGFIIGSHSTYEDNETGSKRTFVSQRNDAEGAEQ